jgi:hypothetical protein
MIFASFIALDMYAVILLLLSTFVNVASVEIEKGENEEEVDPVHFYCAFFSHSSTSM